MSYFNAIKQREAMVQEYKQMLVNETNPTRIEDIQKQIDLCQDEIAQLKIGKPLFGKPTKLTQETKIITADPETKSQKIVVINPHPVEVVEEVTIVDKKESVAEIINNPIASNNPRLENELRKKIQAAKAAKKA